MRERVASHSTLAQDRSQSKVDEAFRRGYLTSAMKDWALSLCMSDEEAFDAFLSMSLPAYAHLTQELLPNAPPQHGANLSISAPDEAAICSQLGLKPEQLNS